MNFFEELQKLREKTPYPSLMILNSQNADYCNFVTNLKNGYLAFGSNGEDVYYSTYLMDSRDIVDCRFLRNCELCYESMDSENCYNCDYVQDCRDCRDSQLLFDCVGCANCFGCASLRHKEYHIFNEKYAPQVYRGKIEQLKKDFHDPEKREQLFLKFESLKEKVPHLYSRQNLSENSIGDYIFNSKNCYICYDARDAEDCMYCERPIKACKDLVDSGYMYDRCELCYEVMSAIQLYNSNFCNMCYYSSDLEYCEYVYNSNHCFGCVSRNHASYEILNVKYEPEEWKKRVEAIKMEMKAQGIYGQHLSSLYPPEDTVLFDYF